MSKLKVVASLLASSVVAGAVTQAHALPKQCEIMDSKSHIIFFFDDGDWAVFGRKQNIIKVCVNGAWVFWFNADDPRPPGTPPGY